MHKFICAVCFCGLDPVWCRLYSCILKVYSIMHNCNHVEFTYAYDLSENLASNCVAYLFADQGEFLLFSLSLSFLLLSGILTGLPGQRSSDDRWARLR